MYVCVCRAVTDHQIREEVAEGACSVADLHDTCGVGSCCGNCVPEAEALVQQLLTQSQAQVMSKTSHKVISVARRPGMAA